MGLGRRRSSGHCRSSESAHTTACLRGAAVALILSGCGGSPFPNFTEASWGVSEIDIVECQGQEQRLTYTETIAFAAVGGGIGNSTIAGCRFEFSVSGDTATLSNGPVTCEDVDYDGFGVGVYQSYTATISDGGQLTTVASGTITVGAKTCDFMTNGSGTREPNHP